MGTGSVLVSDGTGNQVTATVSISVESGLSFPGSTLSYVGCSNTDRAVDGYYENPTGVNAFVPLYGTGGGSLSRWAKNDRNHRQLFVANYVGGPVWIQWCIRNGEGLNQSMPTYEAQVDVSMGWLLSVIAPGTLVWVSAVNTYAPGDRPSQIESEARTNEVVAYTIGTFGFLAGPELGPITSAQTGDGTHPNAEGRAILATQLHDFFDPMVT